MNEEVYHDIALEEAIKSRFGVSAEVDSVIARSFPISMTGEATLFLTKKKQLFLYVDSKSKMVLSDVKKLVSRIGLKAEVYFPPKNRPDYFDEIGREKFREVFPGRAHVSSEDIIFYRTLAPYNPALILIAEVKNGTVYQYDSDATGGWRQAVKFAYRRIRTS